MHLRSATLHDLNPCAALWRERMLILSQADSRFGKLAMTHADWLQTATENLLRVDDTLLMVAETDRIHGFIYGYIDADKIGIIEDIALDAHKYHSGLGRGLWSAMKIWFEQHNVQKIVVRVPRYSAVEQAFWRALGAVETEWTSNKPEFLWMTL